MPMLPHLLLHMLLILPLAPPLSPAVLGSGLSAVLFLHPPRAAAQTSSLNARGRSSNTWR
eukprot:8348773-Pyramimonas_sp.AAC.1